MDPFKISSVIGEEIKWQGQADPEIDIPCLKYFQWTPRIAGVTNPSLDINFLTT